MSEQKCAECGYTGSAVGHWERINKQLCACSAACEMCNDNESVMFCDETKRYECKECHDEGRYYRKEQET